MNRTAIAALLGLALVFAALPGFMALSFLGGPSEATSAVVSTPTAEFRIDQTADDHPLAYGAGDGSQSGCPFEQGADTSGL